MKKYLTVILGGLMTFGAASAQVVTPPAPAPAKTPEYVPPPPPAAQPPAQPKRPDGAQPGVPTKRTKAIPKVDFKPLSEKGPDGKVVPLTDLPQRVALEEVHNPFVKAEHRAKFADYLLKRDHRMESVAVDNLDLVEQIEGGALEKFQYSSKEAQGQAFKNARALTDPINPFGDLISDMVKRELLEFRQALECFLHTIEYQQDHEATSAQPAFHGVDELGLVRALALRGCGTDQ